jgi:hypothetical protein
MPRFSKYFGLDFTQHQLDFVDVTNSHDTPVYVDPYAIEVRDDIWAMRASQLIRVFFQEVLAALRDDDIERAVGLMSHLKEPSETFLGVSKKGKKPKGRGVGPKQLRQLIQAILKSKAYNSGLLSDLSEMTLYVEGIDRDKISDLTTNIIRALLVEYTQEQCGLHSIQTKRYSGPPLWSEERRNWVSKEVMLPYIQSDPILLVPKYIVRRRLSIDGQDFYNKQITDFLITETINAGSSLVRLVKGEAKVYKKDVRDPNPKSKAFIAETVIAHPELLRLYKEIAKTTPAMSAFDDDTPTVTAVCGRLAGIFEHVPTGAANATRYHNLVMGSLTALFYPALIQPRKEWDIHGGRKRIDIVYTNAADTGFFAQRRGDNLVNANTVIVECKNYSDDIANEELDQLLGRFDNNRGKLGIITCRRVVDSARLTERCRDAAGRSQGYMLVLTDTDIMEMLLAKSRLNDEHVEQSLYRKYRDLLA